MSIETVNEKATKVKKAMEEKKCGVLKALVSEYAFDVVATISWHILSLYAIYLFATKDELHGDLTYSTLILCGLLVTATRGIEIIKIVELVKNEDGTGKGGDLDV